MSAMAVRRIEWETWALQEEADRRFRRLVRNILIPALLLGLVVPYLQIAGMKRPEIPATEPRRAELLRPPPPPPKEEPRVEPEAPTKPPPKPQLTQEQRVARAKARATQMLSQLDQLASLRDTTLPKVDQPLTANVITTKPTNPSFAKAATATSAGIGDVGVVERKESKTGLGVRSSTTVSSALGRGHDAGRAGYGGDRFAKKRTQEEIQLVFDRNKGAFYTMYVREQRQRPDMVGKLTVRMTIAPSGRVTACKVVASELNHPEFEKKVVARVLLLDFGAKEVPEITLDYPILFFPS
jgi:protein TonB